MDSMNTLAMEVKDLHIYRGNNHVVRGVSFTVPSGGSVGIVGESGCGKSTILKAIAGIDGGWQGAVWIDGHPLKHQRVLQDRRSLQMVFQDPLAALNPIHTIDETLREPLIIHGFDAQELRIQQALQAVSLPLSVRFRFPSQLSGGQRQRVCIARALLVEPSLLLLDEPTSALDVSVQAEVLNLLSRLRREEGKSLVLVSHDLDVIAHMCETIYVMVKGVFVEQLDRQDLIHGRVRSSMARQLLESSAGI